MRAPKASVLDTLRASPSPLTVQEIATLAGVSMRCALGAVRELERAGLVERHERMHWRPTCESPTGPGWAIVDVATGRPHVARAWPTQDEAHREREELLAPYPPGHEWRLRLIVRAVTKRRSAA